MGEGDKPKYEPPQPVSVQAVMLSHEDLHLWQVDSGLWHWHTGCANVAAAGFFQTVCDQLGDPPEGGYRLDVRGYGSAKKLIAEAWQGVNSSRPYPRMPSYVLGAAVWALARNGISFGFVDTTGKVKLMAKAKKGDAGPEALPSAASSGSVSFFIHDVLLLDCTYQAMGSNIRVYVNKTHLTGSLEALLTAVTGINAPILRGDASTSKIEDTESGELMQLTLDGVIDDLAPKPMGPPRTSHDGSQAKLPGVAEKLGQVLPTPEQSQAAADVDAIASMMNQSADGGESTGVDDDDDGLPFDTLGSLDSIEDIGTLQDLGEEAPGEQMIEVPDDDLDSEIQSLETVGEDDVEVTEMVADVDDTELLKDHSGRTVDGQADIRGRIPTSVPGDDVVIQVEEIDVEEATPVEDITREFGVEDGSSELEGDPEDDGSDAAPPLVDAEELDDIPEPVGSPKADKKTQEAVAQAQVKSPKAATTQQAAGAAARATENTVPTGKVDSPKKDEIPGLRIPTLQELQSYAKQLPEDVQAAIVKNRDAMTLKFKTLETLDGPARKVVGAVWDTHRDKFVGKPIILAHRYLLGAYIAKQLEQHLAKAK